MPFNASFRQQQQHLQTLCGASRVVFANCPVSADSLNPLRRLFADGSHKARALNSLAGLCMADNSNPLSSASSSSSASSATTGAASSPLTAPSGSQSINNLQQQLQPAHQDPVNHPAFGAPPEQEMQTLIAQISDIERPPEIGPAPGRRLVGTVYTAQPRPDPRQHRAI